MLRPSKPLRNAAFDVLIAGGGITGACIARDAALRGLSVALVDKGDFGAATTAASSKLIHGGLRYLQNLELGLVRQSLRERRTWCAIAPHLVSPLPFLLPTTRRGIKKRAALHMALSAYDALSYDRNRLEDPAKHIPRHDNLDRAAAIALEPGLASIDLTGAMRFYDCQMHSPERLALECVLDAAAAGAAVANYTALEGFLRDGNRIAGGTLRDALGGERFEVRAAVTINAAGPWADLLMAGMQGGAPARRLIRSKGIHLVTRPLTQGHAIAVQTAQGHFFLIPWRGRTLIGTTDTRFEGDPDEVTVTEDDIAAFVALVNAGYPAARLERADVQYAYAGLRPIVDMEGQSCGGGAPNGATYGASRAAEVVDHAGGGLEQVITVIGGKWTTSRALAEAAVGLIFEKLGRPAPPCKTAVTPTYGGHYTRLADYAAAARAAHPGLPPEIVDHLVANYGSRLGSVLEAAQGRPEWLQPLGAGRPDLGAQVAYAVRAEMAQCLGDVVFRRTGLGALGHPGLEALERAADIMGSELGWDAARRAAECAAVEASFPAPAPGLAAAAAAAV